MPTRAGTKAKRSTFARRQPNAGSNGGIRSCWAAGRTRDTLPSSGPLTSNFERYVSRCFLFLFSWPLFTFRRYP
jgi:hypothetical protein